MLCARLRKGEGREGGEKRKEKKGREGGEKKKRREVREEGKEGDRRKRGREGGDNSSVHTYGHTRIAVTFESWSAHYRTTLAEVVKTLPCNVEGTGSIPGWGTRSPCALGPKGQNITEAIL